ncbi:MAG: hypothetical protein AMJ90_07760 [candidate division Zixibacteria bacterium SM23_73_2]|nr:MAG: hypothetical protein AMJ90_07760 [candidate division Zixibacteria bacterium SM23_73_2]
MWAFRFFLIIVVIIAVVGFSIYNSSETVEVNLFGLWMYVDVPMIYIAFWAFVVGLLVSFLLGITHYLKVQSDLREQRKENRNLMEEITTLRNIPLEDMEEKGEGE